MGWEWRGGQHSKACDFLSCPVCFFGKLALKLDDLKLAVIRITDFARMKLIILSQQEHK